MSHPVNFFFFFDGGSTIHAKNLKNYKECTWKYYLPVLLCLLCQRCFFKLHSCTAYSFLIYAILGNNTLYTWTEGVIYIVVTCRDFDQRSMTKLLTNCIMCSLSLSLSLCISLVLLNIFAAVSWGKLEMAMGPETRNPMGNYSIRGCLWFSFCPNGSLSGQKCHPSGGAGAGPLSCPPYPLTHGADMQFLFNRWPIRISFHMHCLAQGPCGEELSSKNQRNPNLIPKSWPAASLPRFSSFLSSRCSPHADMPPPPLHCAACLPAATPFCPPSVLHLRLDASQ